MVARSADALRDHARNIPGAMAVPSDLAERGQVLAAISTIEREFGAAPDIVVNNAGNFPLARVEDTSPALFTRTLELNLIAPFALIQSFVGAMRARGSGHVVTIGSIADRTTFPENGAYAASKFGIRALHQVLRDELRGSGVRATLVSPGPVDTPIWDAIGPDERAGFTPRARMLAASAVADAVLFVLTRPPDTNIDELRLSRS
jgi:NADP-dependent 3-hydroxy acid dehydrogenase YdfG